MWDDWAGAKRAIGDSAMSSSKPATFVYVWWATLCFTRHAWLETPSITSAVQPSR